MTTETTAITVPNATKTFRLQSQSQSQPEAQYRSDYDHDVTP